MTLNPDDAIVVDGKLLHVAGTARAATEKRQAGVGHEEDSFGGGGGGLWTYDDVSGVGLDPAMVQQARLKEVQYLREKEVYRKIPRQQAVRMGIPILRSRWVTLTKEMLPPPTIAVGSWPWNSTTRPWTGSLPALHLWRP